MTLDNFWFQAILILALIFANGFFAASEIAMIAMRKSRIEALVDKGVKAAAAVARLKADPDRFLATVQIGVTVVSSFASALGGAAAIGYLKPEIASFAVRSGCPLGGCHRADHRRLADHLFFAGSWRARAKIFSFAVFRAHRLLRCPAH